MNKKSLFIVILLPFAGVLSAFKVPPFTASGAIYITPDGSINPPTSPISTVDKVTYVLTGNITSDTDGIVDERNNTVVDGAGYTVQATGSGIVLSGMRNVTIKNTNFKNFVNGNGILLSSSSNNTIFRNNIDYGSYGIYIRDVAGYNTISGNDITATNYSGIFLEAASNYNSVSGNNVKANHGYGIELFDCFSNSIRGNNITNNGCGIELFASSYYNSFSGNNITNNIGYGILLDSSSSNNFSGNNIKANHDYGFGLYGSYSNSFCHNNFIDNIKGQVYVDTARYANVWDDGYPSGGNYWSDYLTRYPNATEIDSLGIGNTPYVVDANNTDNYPLIHQYTILEFPSIFILPLFMIATLLAVIVRKRKHRGSS